MQITRGRRNTALRLVTNWQERFTSPPTETLSGTSISPANTTPDSLFALWFHALAKVDHFSTLKSNFVDLAAPFCFDHISIWGVDAARQRVFFVTDLTDDLPIHQESFRVLDFGEGFLGKSVQDNNTAIHCLTGAA